MSKYKPRKEKEDHRAVAVMIVAVVIAVLMIIGIAFDLDYTGLSISPFEEEILTTQSVTDPSPLRQIIKGSGTTDDSSSFVIDFTNGTGGMPIQNMSKAFHIISYKHTNPKNKHAAIFKSSEIISSTQLEIFGSTVTTPLPVTYEYTIFEFTDETNIDVERTSLDITGMFKESSLIDNVENISRAFLLHHGHNHNAIETTIGCEEYERVRIVNQSSWEVAVGCAPNTAPQSNKVEVVGWNDPEIIKEVQRGLVTMSNTSNQVTVIPPNYVNRSNALLFVSVRTKPVGDEGLDDDDDDGVDNDDDNCPDVYNPDQLDVNNNGLGDYCEPGCYLIDFNEQSAGNVIDDEYNSIFGLDISAENNNGAHPDKAIIFNSASPTGGDVDLGTPNQDFGGPGIGDGGESGEPGQNDEKLQKLLIIAEDDVDANNDTFVDDPDDEANGGKLNFVFNEGVHILSMKVVDIDLSEDDGEVTTTNIFNVTVTDNDLQNLGDNSLQNMIIDANNVTSLEVILPNSGAVDNLNVCVPTQPAQDDDDDDDDGDDDDNGDDDNGDDDDDNGDDDDDNGDDDDDNGDDDNGDDDDEEEADDDSVEEVADIGQITGLTIAEIEEVASVLENPEYALKPEQIGLFATLNESGAIIIERDLAAVPTIQIAWEIVEFQQGVVGVQHKTINFADGVSTISTAIDPVIAVNASAFGTVSTPFGHGGARSADSTGGATKNHMFTTSLDSNSSITAMRGGSTDTAKLGVQIIEFPSDGKTDTVAPVIEDVFPDEDVFQANFTINISAKVTDLALGTVIASITLPNGSIQNVTLLDPNTDDIFNGTFDNTGLEGTYNLSIIATDLFGNTATFDTFFVIQTEFTFEEDVTDSSGNPITTQVIITDQNETIVFDSLNDSHKGNVAPAIYNITIISRIKEPKVNITFVGVNINGNINQAVDIEQIPKDITFLDPSVIYNDIFAINPVLKAEYEKIVYTAVADAESLYKCRFYDFETRQCLGQWVKIRRDLVPGELYSQEFSPGDPAFGEGSDQVVLKDITIDGNHTDWDAILDSANNVVTDGISGSTDLDVVGSAGRDLTKMAFTWNETYLFLYIKRIVGAGGTNTIVAYIDLDNDGFLNSTDKVARFQWKGSSGKYTFELGDYDPVGVGDNITGDGVDEPGDFTGSSTIESNIPGGNPNKLELEARIDWDDLGVAPGSPLQMHISAAKGSGNNLPSNVEDNMNKVSTEINDVIIFPSRSGNAQANTNVFYNHTIKNLGNVPETFDVTASSTKNFNISLFFENGSVLTDSNSNGLVDVGELNPDVSINITVNISIANVPSGTLDVTTVKANSSTGASSTVVDLTNIGDISIVPRFVGRSANLSTIYYEHTIINNLVTGQIIDLNATSNQDFETTLFYENGSLIVDTNGNSLIDIGNVSGGGKVNISLQIVVPNVVIGTIDFTNIYANTSSDPSVSGAAKDTTIIAPRIEVDPDHDDVAGIGTTIYYDHEVFNNGNLSDVIDLNFTSSLGWLVELLQSDKFTPLNDTDGDTIVDVGNLSKQGGSALIVAKVTVNDTAIQGDSSLTIITGASSISLATDQAVDNTTAQILVTYNDSARTDPNDFFRIGDTIYATGFGIDDNKVVFSWFDANGTTVRISPEITVDTEDQADDEATSNESYLPGIWTVVLSDDKNNEITRINFTVADNNPPLVENVTPIVGSQFDLNVNITIGANVTDDIEVQSVFANVTLPNGSMFILQMFNTTNVTYQVNLTQTDQTGTYNVSITAFDIFQNVNKTEGTSFQVGEEAPGIPILLSPANNASIVDRTPEFIWNNSANPGNLTLTYELLLDNSSTFVALEINETNISEGIVNTSLISPIELDVDTVYFWKVRAFDGSQYSNYSETFNFTLESFVAISLINNLVDFGTIGPGDTDDTDDDDPFPFVLENQGNINVNISITGDPMFINSDFPGPDFQYKADVNESGSFNLSLSTITFTNVTNMSAIIDIFNLDWRDAMDTAETDIKVSIKADEPPGSKNTSITFAVT